MSKSGDSIRLTVAQAIVRWLMNQFIEIDGVETRICGGGFGIFGHGNVPCLGEALYPVHKEMPLYRGQNEQSMGFAAAAYAKYHLRRRFMFCTASAGPGTANLLTAAALAHANRLPMLMLCGDTFLTRLPDPVLQQLEHFGNPTLGVNDAFRAVSRYWDRITHPAQVLQSLPAALATMLDPADCGPAFLGLPQDVQGWAYDYPVAFFDRRVHRIRRQSPDRVEIVEVAALLRGRPAGHAAHPFLTDLPLGAWMSAGILDLVGGERARPAARTLVGVGLLGSVPTSLTGLAEWTHTDPASGRVGALHAVGNTAALALMGLSWLARGHGHHRRGVLLALAGNSVAAASGYLGGHLAIARNVGSRDAAYAGSLPADAPTDLREQMLT